MCIYTSSAVADHHDFTDYEGVVVRFGAVFVYSKRNKKRDQDAPSDVAVLIAIEKSKNWIIIIHDFIQRLLQYDFTRPSDIVNTTIVGRVTDNISTIHHYHMEYYLRHPWLSSGLIEAYHCPTEHMTADLHTKALQEAALNRHADNVLGIVQQQLHPSTDTAVVRVIDTPALIGGAEATVYDHIAIKK